ncbi:2Fe-2S iron-sulfur cluster-binding protein, partial [Mesorhizobium sp. M7A.F.Ca.CA.003.01.2.1]
MTKTTIPVHLDINGRDHDLQLEPRVTLLDALRDRLGLTGTKKGCDHGQCGACTVHI